MQIKSWTGQQRNTAKRLNRQTISTSHDRISQWALKCV